MHIDWNYVPNVSLGPIEIGSDIDDHVRTLGARYDESSADGSPWDSYVIPEHDIYIDVADGRVISITGYKVTSFKDHNLIGMSLIHLGEVLGVTADEVGDPVEFDDGDVKTSYDYFALGLQIWVSNGIVTSATCLSYEN